MPPGPRRKGKGLQKEQGGLAQLRAWLQAGVSPVTHAHLTPPLPPTGFLQGRRGGRHTRCTRQGLWVWRRPPRGLIWGFL